MLTVLVAMGEHTPLHRWLVSLPILSSGRYAVKYTLLTTACLAPLVALALPVIRSSLGASSSSASRTSACS